MLDLVSEGADEALVAADERLRAILDSETLLRGAFESGETLRGVLELHQEQLTGLAWNRNAGELFGVGVPDPRDESLPLWVAAARRSAEERRAVSFDAPHRVGGAVRTFAVEISPLPGAGTHRPRLAWSARDVTPRRLVEALRRGAETSAFAADLSGPLARDLRNLLGVIAAYADLLLPGLGESDPRRDRALEIRVASERAMTLLQRLRLAPPASRSPADEGGPVPRGTETLLLVVGDDVVRRLLRELTQELGYTVLSAFGPAMALELATHHTGPIHLLLADLAGAEAGGRELAGRLGATHPGLRSLFLADEAPAQGAREASGAVLVKPVRLAPLARALREVLGPAPRD